MATNTDLGAAVRQNTAATGQVLQAYVQSGRDKAARRRQAGKDLAASLRSLGETWKRHRDWQDAKREEDELRQVADAETAALIRGGPEAVGDTLAALPLRHARAALSRNAAVQRANKSILDNVERERSRALEYTREEQRMLDRAERQKIAQAEEMRQRQEEARAAAQEQRRIAEFNANPPRPKMTPEQEFADWQRKEAYKATLGMATQAPRQPSGSEVAVPDWELREHEKRLGYPKGTLPTGTTAGTIQRLRASDDELKDDEIRNLRAEKAKFENETRQSPEEKEARRALEKAQDQLDDFDMKEARTGMTEKVGRDEKAVAQIRSKLMKNVEAALQKYEAAKGSGSGGAPQGDPEKVRALQAAGWKWNGSGWEPPAK